MKRVALYAAALGFVVFAGFPFYWMLVTSFKQNRDLYVGASDMSHIPWIFNDPPTLEHVKLLLGQTDFPRWVLNTLVVVVAVVVITVAVAVLFGVVYTATDLGVVYILTGGGPANTTHVLPTLAFQRGILGADLGQGAAIAVFLLPFLIVVAIGMLRLAHRTEVGGAGGAL